MKTLHFSVEIKATKEKVWDKMLEAESYKKWTHAFYPGSYYEGSWDKGAKIKFLGPGGSEGMTSEIAENKPHEFVSVRHLGFIKDGVEDFDSPEIKSWAPAYENYSFSEKDGVTTVNIDIDVAPMFEEDMATLWPKALQKLKEICE